MNWQQHNAMSSKHAIVRNFIERKHVEALNRHDTRRSESLRAEAARRGIRIEPPVMVTV